MKLLSYHLPARHRRQHRGMPHGVQITIIIELLCAPYIIFVDGLSGGLENISSAISRKKNAFLALYPQDEGAKKAKKKITVPSRTASVLT